MGIFAFLCLNIQTIEATSLQYRSNDFVSDADSAIWPSVDGSLSLTSVHTATNVSIASVLTTLGINAGGTFNSVLLVR